MNSCPICHERGIGKVGVDQYFCWECCLEFSLSGDDMKIFSVEADGSLTLFADSDQSMLNMQI